MDPRLDDGLSLEANVEPVESGWTVRVPLRAEVIHVTKETVIRERVTVQHRTVRGTAHVVGTVRREQVRVRTSGDLVENREPLDGTPPNVRPRRPTRPDA